MKLLIIKSNLREGLSAAEKAIGDNSSLPILKNVLLETENNKLKLTATNLEIAISYSVSGKIIDEGKATIPLNIFSNLINNISSERLNLLEDKNNNLEIKTDNYQAFIQGQPPKEFPIIPKIKNYSQYLEISSPILRDALEEILAASQISDLRPELNSVLFRFSLENLILTATDSFRLAEKIIGNSQFKSNHQENFRIMVPLKTCQEILKILKKEELIRIYYDQTQILFKTDSLEFISRLMEGNFPEYDYLVPHKFNSEIVVDRQEFINAIKLSGIFSVRGNEVKIKISDNKKLIEIFSAEQGVGENKYLLSAKTQGKPGEVNFNWRYLLDGLRALKTKEVFLGLNEENKPALLKSPNDGSYFYILMPIINNPRIP